MRHCRTLFFVAIEFNPVKDAANIEIHGISLAIADRLLAGFTVEWIDDRIDYGETRVIALGEIDGLEFVCIYTMRGENHRPISLRRAKRKERDVYRQAKGR